MFLRSRKSGPYTSGQAEAEAGSLIIETDYLTWSRTPAANQADSALSAHAMRVRETWSQIRRRGLADGPAAAADRYQALAAAATDLADALTPEFRCAALPPLLDLASHAGKHAIRLRATADAQAAKTPAGDESVQALTAQFETSPGTKREARSSDGEQGGVSSRRLARTRKLSQARAEREH
jgi:hypothetical protein